MEKNNDIHNFKILTIYSVVAYLTAYFIVFLFYNFVTIIVANLYDIKTTLLHTKLVFSAKNGSPLWTFDSAFNVFSAGPILLTIATIFLLRFYNRYKTNVGLLKMFLFWIILHSINRILGLFIIGTIFDLWYSNVILDWIFVSYWVKIIIVIGVFALLIGIGSKTTRPLLLSAKSFKFVEDRKRLFFVWSQAFKVWFFSSIFLFIIHLPSLSLPENFLSVSMLLLIFPSYFNHHAYDIPHSDSKREEPEYKIPWNYIIFASVFILLFRIIFWKGISF
jgi:hypothetical protein